MNSPGSDVLGSTEALTTSTGAEQATYTYAPYGSFSIAGATSNSYDYTGRESDGLGLEYYRARYYNPNIGRFISEDPAGFAGSGPDLYQYAGDDPIDFTDLFGMDRGPNLHGVPYDCGAGGCVAQDPSVGWGQGPCGGALWYTFGGGCAPWQSLNNDDNLTTCSAAQQFLANAGSQLTATGQHLAWGGLGTDLLSGSGAIVAPEGAPLEVAGGEAGTAMIEIGGVMSKLGAALTGYAQSDFGGAIEGVANEYISDAVGKLGTAAFFPGLNNTTKAAMQELLGEIPDALRQEATLCGAS